MTSVTVRGLTKAYDGQQVLAGVDLDVPERSVTAVLGPSGCGKTTMLRIIAGFTEPDAGTVSLGGRVVAGGSRPVPAQDRKVGYVAQEGALFPHLDVGANIAFGLPRRQRRDGARVAELVERVGLDPSYARRYPHELSGGQQQRVALARALAPNPAIVLLDEPFSSLDAGLRESTGRAVVDALHAAEATAILVTHDQSEALSLADQVAVMRDGRLAQTGSPVAVYRAPADPGVATFVGGANLLPASVDGLVATCALGRLDVAPGYTVAEGPAVVLVRPEQIRLLPAADGGSRSGGSDDVPARVSDVVFYGHDAAVRLDLPGGARLTSRVVGTEAPEPGTGVRLQVLGPVTAFAGDAG
jgi:iron(III) transport system ATP-binding protein